MLQYDRDSTIFDRAAQVYHVIVAHVMQPRLSQKMTYGEVHNIIEWHRPPLALSHPLGAIGWWCRENDIPCINNVVVSLATGVPGVGVITRPGKTPAQELAESYDFDWFGIVPPTVGELAAAHQRGREENWGRGSVINLGEALQDMMFPAE